jgi:hypothetical protein
VGKNTLLASFCSLPLFFGTKRLRPIRSSRKERSRAFFVDLKPREKWVVPFCRLCFHHIIVLVLVLLVLRPKGDFDYRTSMKYPVTLYATKERTCSYTPSQLGLTMTGNGPENSTPSNQGTPATLNSTLNEQDTYNAFQPQLPMNVINNIISWINNIISTEQQDNLDERMDKEEEEFDGNQPFDDDEVDSIAQEPPLVIVKQNPLNRPSKLLTTEIELMNIVRTSQLPLNTFKKIWNWVGRGQVRNVNFSNPGRVQTTVVDKF